MPLPWLTFVRVKTSEADRRAALDASPIEQIAQPEQAFTLVGGGRQTKGALPVSSEHFEGAVYSSRGRGYARYNEDAAGLYADARGAVYASVFDQAGGLGGSVRGAASELAAKTAFVGFRDLAVGPQTADIPARLRRSIDEAHETLVARGEGEVTTAVLAVATQGRAVLVNSGDSAAMRFNAKGEIQAVTDKHEVQSPLGVGCLVHAVGLVPEGPASDTYEWPLSSGDWLLMGSDGLLDAGLELADVGAVLADAKSAELATNELARQILKRMTLMQAKPDNLTIVAIRAR